MSEALKSASILLKVSSEGGSRIEASYQSNRRGAKVQATPQQTMVEAVAEMARLAEFCGFGQAFADEVEAARKRVQEYRAGVSAERAIDQ
jgi:hypothetical protein